jgi:hypothetical protein
VTLANDRLPYGLRDVKVATLSNVGVKGTLVDLPNGQTFEFTESTSTQELRGDDAVKANRTTVDAVAWSLDAGGINFEAMQVIAGGTITTSGTTPATVKKWRRMEGESYPDFYLVGKAMSESGGDHQTVIHRAKATQISGTHQDQEFWVSHAEGTGIGTLAAANVGAVWDMLADEDATTAIA